MRKQRLGRKSRISAAFPSQLAVTEVTPAVHTHTRNNSKVMTSPPPCPRRPSSWAGGPHPPRHPAKPGSWKRPEAHAGSQVLMQKKIHVSSRGSRCVRSIHVLMSQWGSSLAAVYRRCNYPAQPRPSNTIMRPSISGSATRA